MPIKRECVYSECPVEAALDLVGGKWRTMIVGLLLERTHRFNELKRRLRGVTHRVLAAQLRDMEDCGLVARTVYPEVPPRVEYSLTDLGRSLEPVIESLRSWGQTYALQARLSLKDQGAISEPLGGSRAPV